MVVPDSLEGFSPGLYVAALAEVAHSDGLHASETAILEDHAARFGIDLDKLPVLPADLSDLPAATRILVYRDAYMLAMADGELSEPEEQKLALLGRRLRLMSTVTESTRVWVDDFSKLLERFEELVRTVD